MAHTESGYVEVSGGRLPYDVAGEGHPLVLIHAGVADRTMWEPQWEEFAKPFRVIRYDTRGFGAFKTEAVPFSNRQDLRDLLDHLDVQSAYILGCSRGGQIASDFVLEFPERADALIHVNGGLSGFMPTETAANAHEWRMFEEMEALEEAQEWDRLADLEVQMWVNGPSQSPDRADPAVREQVRQWVLANYHANQTQGQPIVLDPPAFGRLETLTLPTLVIVGDLDTSETLEMAEVIVQRAPNARKEVISGTAHLPSLEKPEQFNRLVIDFLKSIE